MFLHAVFCFTLWFRGLLARVEFQLHGQCTSPGVERLSKWNSAKSLVTCTDPVQSCFPPAKLHPMPSNMSANLVGLFTFAMSWGSEGELLSFIKTADVSGEKNGYPTPLSALTEEVRLPAFLWHLLVPQDAIICFGVWEQWDAWGYASSLKGKLYSSCSGQACFWSYTCSLPLLGGRSNVV